MSGCEPDWFLTQEDLKAPNSALRDMLTTVSIVAPAKLQAKHPVAPTFSVNLPLDDSDWKCDKYAFSVLDSVCAKMSA